MLLTPAEMRATEDAAFAAGATAADLMEQAGSGIADAVRQFLPRPGTVVAFIARGHNGGDALVAARHLRQHGWHVVVRLLGPPGELKPLTHQHLESLAAPALLAHDTTDLPGHRTGTPIALLDGILGIGASGPLKGDCRRATAHLNHLRHHHHATTFAIDLPTGVDGTTGVPSHDAVLADVTITVAHPKSGLLADPATPHVGRLVVVPLRALDAPPSAASDAVLATPQHLRPHLPRLPVDAHKGDAGRVAIVAGSTGLTGAAVLCTSAAVHAGAGLTTLYTPVDAYPTVAAQAPPEVMVKPLTDLRSALDTPHDVLAVGPGLGTTRSAEILDLITRASSPLILDADALNALAENHLESLARRSAPTLLTPHPGEMRRLLAGAEITDRLTTATSFATAHPNTTLLLKGARTLVATAGHPATYNPTGSPAMASGGMGDTLTGIAAALAARNTSDHLHHTASLAAWIHGRAAEIALANTAASTESLTASTLTNHLGRAFDDLRQLVF